MAGYKYKQNMSHSLRGRLQVKNTEHEPQSPWQATSKNRTLTTATMAGYKYKQNMNHSHRGRLQVKTEH